MEVLTLVAGWFDEALCIAQGRCEDKDQEEKHQKFLGKGTEKIKEGICFHMFCQIAIVAI